MGETEPGRVLLLSCYELGRQPLGIAWPAAFLRKAGVQPSTLDLSVQTPESEILRRATFAVISVPMHTALRLGVKAAERIRALNPDCHICFFGLYAQLNARHLLSTVADSVIGGEGEEALVALVRSVEVEGAKESSVKDRLSGPVLRKLNFPVPDRTGLPGLDKYARLEIAGETRLAGAVEASRGCKHTCLHCPIPPVYGGRFFVVPMETVLADVRNLVQAGARHITFGDPDFLNGPGHSLGIVRAMHREFPELTFDFTAKVEHILKHRELFPSLAEMGCLFVISAVESLSDTVLGKLKKGHSRSDVLDALDVVRAAGISLRSSWVAFTPWTTLKDYLDMLDFMEERGLIEQVDPVQLSIRLLVPPGSAMLAGSGIAPHLRGLDQANFFHRWSHPDPRMDELHEKVSRKVEEAASRDKDAYATFAAIRSLALQAAGLPERSGPRRPDGSRLPPPRLSESWFCCAEPTREQFSPLAGSI